MEKNIEEAILATLQDILIFQMTSKGVPQSQIREAVGVDNNRVSRIARLAEKSGKKEE
jgi:predicted XRE-type DNA-binding protein